ncbi:heparinase II/III domain-containing protein [Paenibacillus senegalensis]|uniref:heparinase II/III domain-containing protein n=1 Tax=Paenibacillus senegalensis TaxID=1465766 RepID=UPI000289388B|nr:heparinase II/III family protein [Paenibacillus senegalensis]
MNQQLKKSLVCMLIFLLMVPTTFAIGMETAGAEIEAHQETESAEIEVFQDKWSVISAVYDSIQIDGDLSDPAWEYGERLDSWEKVYNLNPPEAKQDVRIRYDDQYLYIGLAYEHADQGESLKSVDVLVSTASAGERYYRIPIQIQATELSYVNNWGPNTTTVQPARSVVKVDNGILFAEASVSLSSLGVSEVTDGEEWRLNVLFQHQYNTKPLSAWVPVRTAKTVYTGTNRMVTEANVTDEGRLGSVFVGSLPPSHIQWTPEALRLDYIGYQEKQLSFAGSDLEALHASLVMYWKEPGKEWETLNDVRIVQQQDRMAARFSHPAPRSNGLYQLKIEAPDAGGKTKTAIVSFDRRAMIEAGDSLYIPETTAPGGKTPVQLEPPSERVQKLLDLIPEASGFLFTGLPDQPEMIPTGNNYTWDPENPDKLTSAFSGMVFPNEQYPEDQMLRVKNRLGEWVEYPYYEDEEGRRYFITAHRWYKQRDYVLGQLLSVANEDPLGAARLLIRFAEVAEGYVPTHDYRWSNNIVDPDVGPPYEYWGGMWYRWAAADLVNLPTLANVYAIVNQTNAFELLSGEMGIDTHDYVVDMMLASVDFYHTFPVIYSNMEYHNMLGLIALAKALNDPKYIHEAVEWSQHFAMNTYLFDGFFKEVTISYHNQSTNGINMVINALKGWTDPQGYVSPRTGLRFENLDLGNEFPALSGAAEIPNLVVYPNGQSFPTNDTWAFEKGARPQLNAGSFLLPASGIARLARGTAGDGAIDPAFGIVTDFQNMEIVAQSAETRYFSSSGTVQFEAEAEGHSLTYAFDVSEDDTYEIALKPFRAGSYGLYDILIDGRVITNVNFHSPSGGESGVGEFEPLGEVELAAGTHEITFLNTGKVTESTNYKLGIIQLALLDEQARQERDEWEDNGNSDSIEPMQVYTTFQPKYGHHHHDPLNLALFAKGQELLPDIGYTHTLQRQWTNSTMAHNTVVVNSQDAASTGNAQHGGNIDTFISNEGGPQALRAAHPTAYAGTEEYTREPWMIPFLDDPQQGGYVLDLFRVYGGNRHEYTLNGDANRDALFETDLPLEEYGPYLLPEGVAVREPEGEMDRGDAEGHYYGYIYVRDVEKADVPNGQYELALKTQDAEGDNLSNLKITGLVEPGQNELFIGESPSLRATRTGSVASDNNIEAVNYFLPKMVLRREGTNLQSNFVHVLEPYGAEEQPLIEDMTRLQPADGKPGDIAVAISYGEVTDIILSSLDPTEPLVVDDMTLVGKMGLIRLKDGAVKEMHLFGGTLLQKGTEQVLAEGPASGQISEVLRLGAGDGVNGFLTSSDVSAALKGRTIVVTHPNGKTHGYPIKDIRAHGEYTLIELNEMDPGFAIHRDGTSEMLFTPFLKWSGSHRFHIENYDKWSGAGPGLITLEITGLDSPASAGSSGQIKADMVSGDGTRENVSEWAGYSSSDSTVAEVQPDGVVLYKTPGTTVIGAAYGPYTAEPITVEVVGTAASTSAPGKPVLSDNSGHSSGLSDGSYTVTMNMWWGNNGSVYRLYENDVLVDTQLLRDGSPGAQTAKTAISGKANGMYTYRAELINGYGVTSSDPHTVTVSNAAPGVPELSHDNWDGDGTYTVTMNMWWGTNARVYRLYEDGKLIDEQPLVPATPGAQTAQTVISNKPAGTYEYRAELVNDAGVTSSSVLKVTVDRQHK